jgi:prepilin-type processing-associated H-X9-DG protein
MKIMRVTALFLACLMAISIFAGCGKDKTDGASGNGETITVIKDGESDFNIIKPENFTTNEQVASTELFKAYKTLGATLGNRTDDSAQSADTPEIIIGNTNRPETESAKQLLVENTKMYANDFYEKFPVYGAAGAATHNGTSLGLLVAENFLTDVKVYLCPSAAHEPSSVAVGETFARTNGFSAASGSAGNYSYGYIAGLNENHGADSGLAFDIGSSTSGGKSNHDKYGNILYIDGSARASTGNIWFKDIKYWGTKDGPESNTELFTNAAKPPTNLWNGTKGQIMID